jgi:hypothetical protein
MISTGRYPVVTAVDHRADDDHPYRAGPWRPQTTDDLSVF